MQGKANFEKSEPGKLLQLFQKHNPVSCERMKFPQIHLLQVKGNYKKLQGITNRIQQFSLSYKLKKLWGNRNKTFKKAYAWFGQKYLKVDYKQNNNFLYMLLIVSQMTCMDPCEHEKLVLASRIIYLSRTTWRHFFSWLSVILNNALLHVLFYPHCMHF